MTLGLATCDETGIYLAIESQGLPLAGPTVKHEFPLLLNSKILRLAIEPEVVVLAAGGLDHWAYVVAHYSVSSLVTAAALEIATLLNCCMTDQNQAFGLVCGYEQGNPKCYRLNRHLGSRTTDDPVEEDLAKIPAVGAYADEAQRAAHRAIECGTPPLVALVEAIGSLLPRPEITRPIHSHVIRDGK